MAVFSWRRRPTKHFGEVWIPFAQVEIQGSEGHFQAFAIQIDSGATVSLLRRSVAELLGIELEAGRRIDLTGVGGAQTTVYVHHLPTRLEDKWPPLDIPFAIADVEAVPNLLGRLGIFDRVQVDFDVSVRETRLSAPWLDDKHRLIWELLKTTQTHILSRWEQLDWPNPTKEAARRMVSQTGLLLASAAGLAKLHRHHAGPLFIRALFELSAQFEYMMQEPEARAQQYLDFEHVTRYQEQQACLAHPKTSLGRMMTSSPLREEGEAKVNKAFERVRPRFLRSDGKTLWRSWHGLQFRQLVEGLPSDEVNWGAEYDQLYKSFSAWAHGDPFPAAYISPNSPERGLDLLVQCYIYYARMLLRIADELILTSEQYGLLKGLAKGLT